MAQTMAQQVGHRVDRRSSSLTAQRKMLVAFLFVLIAGDFGWCQVGEANSSAGRGGDVVLMSATSPSGGANQTSSQPFFLSLSREPVISCTATDTISSQGPAQAYSVRRPEQVQLAPSPCTRTQ
jgi:hypothetical protein